MSTLRTTKELLTDFLLVVLFFFIFTIYMIIETHYDKYQLNYFLLLFNFMLFTKSKGTVHQRKIKGKKCRMLMEVIYIIME